MKKISLLLLFLFVSGNAIFAQHITGTSFQVFNHTSFTNQNKTYPITGVWCPTPKEIDKYNIMCIFCKKYYSSSYYIMLPTESHNKSWINNLTGMKELFLKNDKIAKENGVTSDINKNVSDKFSFEGFYGEGPGYSYGPIVKEYSGKGHEFAVFVLYKYKDGKSSIEMHIGDYYLNSSDLVWKFESLDDFDQMINALNWSNFMATFNDQVKGYKEQQEAANAAAKKQQEESSLFD